MLERSSVDSERIWVPIKTTFKDVHIESNFLSKLVDSADAPVPRSDSTNTTKQNATFHATSMSRRLQETPKGKDRQGRDNSYPLNPTTH